MSGLAKRANVLLEKMSTIKHQFSADERHRLEMEVYHELKNRAKAKHMKKMSKERRFRQLVKKARHDEFEKNRDMNSKQYYKWYQYYVRSVEKRHKTRDVKARELRERVQKRWQRFDKKRRKRHEDKEGAAKQEVRQRLEKLQRKDQYSKYRLWELQKMRDKEKKKRRAHHEWIAARNRQHLRAVEYETKERQKQLLDKFKHHDSQHRAREEMKKMYAHEMRVRRKDEQNLKHELEALWRKAELAKDPLEIEEIHARVEDVVRRVKACERQGKLPWPGKIGPRSGSYSSPSNSGSYLPPINDGYQRRRRTSSGFGSPNSPTPFMTQ